MSKIRVEFTGVCSRYSHLTTLQCLIIFDIQWNEDSDLLGYYVASSGNFLPTFRDYVSVPSTGVKKAFGFLTPQDGTEGCPATSVRNYHYSPRNNTEERGFSSTVRQELEIIYWAKYLWTEGNLSAVRSEFVIFQTQLQLLPVWQYQYMSWI